MAVDKGQVRELELYIENDYTLYKQMQAFLANYSLKRKRGTFDKAKAIKGLLNVVRAAITKYNRELGSIGTVNKETKEAVAKELFKTLWDAYGLKNVRKMRPKKKKR